jgi:hypothetical protein
MRAARGTELSWQPDGETVFLGLFNQEPCRSPGSRADIFGFNVHTGMLANSLKSGLLVGDIAAAANNRLLAVDSGCLGIFRNHNPKLKVFDLNTGKLIRDISYDDRGVRYRVSVSQNGTRALAYTGKMRAQVDWLDFAPFDTVLDETFSVWNLTDYSEIATSQNIKGLKSSEIRISPDGKFAVAYGRVSSIYELPQ